MLYDTDLVFLKDSYLTELQTTLIEVGQDETGAPMLYLDSTLFYPEGGGQPSDTGTITGPHGTAKVTHARYMHGVVAHQCEIEGVFSPEETVTCRIDWEGRHRNMRAHTAGHILHDALVQLPGMAGVSPLKGNHKKLYVDYAGDTLIPADLAPALEQKCNEIIAADYPLEFRQVSLDELKQICEYVPANLPADKPLRVVKIGPFGAIPCGGTHVRRTGEVGPMQILGIHMKKGVNHIKYQLDFLPD